MSEKNTKTLTEEQEDTKGLPGFVSSWNQMYGIVIGELVLLIALFLAFSLYFS